MVVGDGGGQSVTWQYNGLEVGLVSIKFSSHVTTELGKRALSDSITSKMATHIFEPQTRWIGQGEEVWGMGVLHTNPSR
jgi:hypothetical protein